MTSKYNTPGAQWSGIHEHQPAGWVGQCAGCDRVYVLEKGDADKEGFLVGFPCMAQKAPTGRHWPGCPGGNRYTTCTCYDMNGNPGMPRMCMDRIKRLPHQRALRAAWALGGIDALLLLINPRKG